MRVLDFFLFNPISSERKVYAWYYLGLISGAVFMILHSISIFIDVRANQITYSTVSGVVEEVRRTGVFLVRGNREYVFVPCDYRLKVGDHVDGKFVDVFANIKPFGRQDAAIVQLDVDGIRKCETTFSVDAFSSRVSSDIFIYSVFLLIVLIFYSRFCAKCGREL